MLSDEVQDQQKNPVVFRFPQYSYGKPFYSYQLDLAFFKLRGQNLWGFAPHKSYKYMAAISSFKHVSKHQKFTKGLHIVFEGLKSRMLHEMLL